MEQSLTAALPILVGMPLNQQDAVNLIENEMRVLSGGRRSEPFRAMHNYTSYGYDIYLSALAANELPEAEYNTQAHGQAVGALLDAAWWFVGRGLLRPGVRVAGEQATAEGAYAGFSVTVLGREWLLREAPPELPVTSPSRMNALLDAHRVRFGDGYGRRATEAVNCYDVRQYLASCVMAGAAAEGILLTAVIAKTGDEAEALKQYAGRSGRAWAENQLTGQAPGHVKDEYRTYMGLLKFWRDSAAHGAVSEIAEEEAYLAIVSLARFAQFMEKHWTTFTGQQ